MTEGADLERYLSEGRCQRAALLEDVGAKTRQPLDAEGQVDLEVLFEALLLLVGEDGVGQPLGVGRGQRVVGQRVENAVDADLRR